MIEYEPFDGTGAIGDGTEIPAVIGANGISSNSNMSGLAYVPGKVAQAITFDGIDDDITIPLPSIDTAQGDAVSIAFWMQWNGVLYAGNNGEWTKVVLFQSPEYALTYVASQNGPSLGYNTGAGDLWGLGAAGLGSKWIHVVAVFANGASNESLLYLDGQAQPLAQTLGSPTSSHVSASLLVAAFPSYPSFYTGALDELAVWNIALSPDEVGILYGAQVQCP